MNKKQKTYLERFNDSIEKLKDVNANFNISGKHFDRINEVINELEELYKEEKASEQIAKEISKNICDAFNRVSKETYVDLNKNFVH